jgi:hypothetical protein
MMINEKSNINLLVFVRFLEILIIFELPRKTIYPHFYGYFQFAGILSFQKSYICLKKIFGTSKLFKKMWYTLFSANFDFGAKALV